MDRSNSGGAHKHTTDAGMLPSREWGIPWGSLSSTMGKGRSKQLTISRVNNDGNQAWAEETIVEQTNPTEAVRVPSAGGEESHGVLLISHQQRLLQPISNRQRQQWWLVRIRKRKQQKSKPTYYNGRYDAFCWGLGILQGSAAFTAHRDNDNQLTMGMGQQRWPIRDGQRK